MTTENLNSIRERAAFITQRLEQHFGDPVQKTRSRPMDNLVLTILSQNTNDRNRDIAYRQLRERYASWEEVKDADLDEIEIAVRPAGLGKQKASTIKNVLNWISDTYGDLNIDFLCHMDPWEAIETFTTQKGIGIKTMAVVLCFSCGIDVFPVDTHVHRICRRLEFVPDKATADKTFRLMKDVVPVGKSYSLHVNFLRLGRQICHARKPMCEICPIRENCPFGKARFD
ncbi:endonuclease III [candidate division KSB1 bacterium]|nr:endonuclease III [candidate division KSB1 bacterium]